MLLRSVLPGVLYAAVFASIAAIDQSNARDFADTHFETVSTPGRVPSCKPSEVSIKDSPFGDDGGVISNVYYVAYEGKGACSVKGYPTLATYDEAGKPLSTGVTHESGGNYSNVSSTEETTVILSPNGRRAWFLIEAAGGCDTGLKVKVALPNSRSWLRTLDYPGGGCTPVDVSPVRPLSALSPPE